MPSFNARPVFLPTFLALTATVLPTDAAVVRLNLPTAVAVDRAPPRKEPKLDVKNWQVEPMNSATEVENVKGGPSEGESNRGKSNLDAL